MDAKDTLIRFLEELGKEMGAPLALDAEGICLIETDDGTECEISALPDSPDFLLTSLVGEVRETDGQDFYVRLMELNSDVGQSLGATIALDRDNRLLMLHQMHSVAGLEQADFDRFIQDFYSLTDSLSQLIRSRDFAAADAAGSDEPDEPGKAAQPVRQDRPWQRV